MTVSISFKDLLFFELTYPEFQPPDGQNGRCRMYIWNTATPYRDGDLEAGIVIHELSHGLSTRLTGGPRDSSCLGWGESGGMGEGWGGK